jgi:hypothetical protein
VTFTLMDVARQSTLKVCQAVKSPSTAAATVPGAASATTRPCRLRRAGSDVSANDSEPSAWLSGRGQSPMIWP